MNTQAHVLLAAALLCKPSNAGPNAASGTSNKARFNNLAVIVGALIPDVSLYIMFAQARLRGISHDVIWGELYYSAFWQEIGAMTNSIPLFVGLAIAGFWLSRKTPQIGSIVLLFALAAALHCATDLPLHVDDGHPHFWPFTSWIYASPVSYWDPNHYSHVWQPIEFLLACGCSLYIWRQFRSMWIRIAVITALLSYPAMMAMWFSLS